MPEIKRETVVPLPIKKAWPFIADYNNWAHDMPGYEKHDTISDRESVWYITGHVGPINKTVQMRVSINEWVEETMVAFTVDTEGLPVSGNGSVNIKENGPQETHMTFKLYMNCTGIIGNLVNGQLAKMLPGMCDGFIKDLAEDIIANSKGVKEARMMKNIGVRTDWDIEADVVIVGAGGAGMAAAIESARTGDKVVVLETAREVGGSTTLCGGVIYLGGGTGLQKECGVEDTVEDMQKYLSAAMGPGADEKKIKLYCDKSLETYDWLISLGVPFNPVYDRSKIIMFWDDSGLYYTGNEDNYPYNTFAKAAPRGHQVAGMGPSGNVLIEHMKNAAEAAGTTIICRAEATDLIVDSNRVVGLRANIEDAEKFVRARKAIILCAGGFQANKEMVAKHAHPYTKATKYVGTEFDQGQGIAMAQAIGAEVRGMNNCSDWMFIYPPGSKCKSIIVNSVAQRFIDESQYGAYIGSAIVENKNGTAYLIMDSKVFEEAKKELDVICQNQVLVSIAEAAGMSTASLAGDMTMCAEAQTIGELAEKLQINPDILEGTVAVYNISAAKGEDVLFHKGKKYLTPLDSPPYYAADIGSSAEPDLHSGFITLGGLETDLESRVLDVKGNPIPGLYAAGRNASGIQGGGYNTGTSVGDGLIFGRIAGKNASAELVK